MEKQKKVIDASVIFKWFSKEEDSEKALKLKEEHLSQKSSLVIPVLSIIEVINALKYKEKDENKLKEANKALKEIQLEIKNITKFLMDKAIENSFKYDISIYDSVYVALAQIHGVSLITADSALYKIPNVIPLEKI